MTIRRNTIELLRDRADALRGYLAADDFGGFDSEDEVHECLDPVEQALAAGTLNADALDEIDHYIDWEKLTDPVTRDVLRDAIDAGLRDEYNPKAIYSRRPRTMKYAGKVWEV